MAGVTVTVRLPAEAADDVEGALTKALAPFYSDTEDNPVGRGMWYSRRIRVGSNGAGFAVAAGHDDDPRLIKDDSAPDGTPRPSAPGVCERRGPGTNVKHLTRQTTSDTEPTVRTTASC